MGVAIYVGWTAENKRAIVIKLKAEVCWDEGKCWKRIDVSSSNGML
jgi:hypothetical protein